MHPRTLVTGAGGAAAVAVLRTLAGEEMTLFAADMDPCAVGLYLVPRQRRVILPAGADPAFVPQLLEACRRHRIELLVPTVDAELLPLARARARFEEIGVKLVLAPEASLTLCLDKRRLLEVCVGRVPVPRFATFDQEFRTAGWQYPLVVKPRSGSGGRGVVVVRSPEELEALPRSSDLLVQEYLPGEEYSVDVLANPEGEILAVVPRARLKVDSGVAVAGYTLHHPTLELFAARVAQQVRLTYVANIQFRCNARGVPALLEVNPRFPGTMPLTVASGVNMPRLAIQEALGRRTPRTELAFRELAMVRFWEELYLDPSELAQLGAPVTTAPDRGKPAASFLQAVQPA